MKIVVKADQAQKLAFLQMSLPDTLELVWYEAGMNQMLDFEQDVVAYLDCNYETEGFAFAQIHQKPVFVHAVLATSQLLPINAIRINAWEGFLERPIWELACNNSDIKTEAEKVLRHLNKSFAWVPDQPGLIAARVVAMIINEAFFALGDGVSSKESIDIAMKLGTNYPWGPFEWATKIGLNNIISLLTQLSEVNERYHPAPKLLEEQANLLIMASKNN